MISTPATSSTLLPMVLGRIHPGVVACMLASIRRTYAYRARFLLWLVRAMAELYLLRMVWTALYDGRDAVDGIPAGMLIVFLTVAMLQEFLIQPVVVFEIDQRIMRGTVASDIVRPVGFMSQMLAYDVGGLLGRAPVLLVAVPVATLVGSLRLPPTPEAAVGYVVSLMLAYLISLLVWTLVGLAAFWMTSIGGLRFLLFTLQGFLAGAIVPLWFLPGGVRAALELLPFQGMAFLPVSIYIGQTTGWAIAGSLAIQAFWVVVLAALASLVWRRARWKLVVQGG
jgi:ABC-2 type transport system permease protein